jgi:hypothetical protein
MEKGYMLDWSDCGKVGLAQEMEANWQRYDGFLANGENEDGTPFTVRQAYDAVKEECIDRLVKNYDGPTSTDMFSNGFSMEKRTAASRFVQWYF